MLLQDKVCLIHGAGGAIGGAVARTFAREGAQLFLSGRSLASVNDAAKDIVTAGGKAEAASVDALDEDAVERHTADVANKADRIDVVLNATGSGAVQGVPLIDLKREDFASPIATWTITQFLTARALRGTWCRSARASISRSRLRPRAWPSPRPGALASRARR